MCRLWMELLWIVDVPGHKVAYERYAHLQVSA
jgi:hypothetical protein